MKIEGKCGQENEELCKGAESSQGFAGWTALLSPRENGGGEGELNWYKSTKF